MKKLIKLFLAAAVAVSFTAFPAAQAEETAEVKITADKLTFLYDKKEFTVKPGQKVKLTFVNPKDSVNLQPHNLMIVKAGKLQSMIAVVNDPALFADPNWLKDPTPRVENDKGEKEIHGDILHHTKLLKVGEEETLEFTAPEEPGDYPYLCTYIGHAILMNGVMKVEK